MGVTAGILWLKILENKNIYILCSRSWTENFIEKGDTILNGVNKSFCGILIKVVDDRIT